MEKWQELEFIYAKRLRECNRENRKKLYLEAYSEVSRLAIKSFRSTDPEQRTAGTSKRLAFSLSHHISTDDHILEIGCGRGYTCFKLASLAGSIVGIEVSKASILEAKDLISKHEIDNVTIEQISAIDIQEHFSNCTFDTALSIDVVEHLHPEDAADHFHQVYDVLKPNGKYMIVMPNRLNGPHDLTRVVFPKAKEPLGFHLNESTYADTIEILRSVGFRKFHAMFGKKLILAKINIYMEKPYSFLPKRFRFKVFFNRFLPIRLVAYKAGKK